MADRPSEFPEWASAPPPSSITSPTTPERQAGDQPAGAPVGAGPRRQFHNWLFNLIYRWLLWLHQAIFRASDLMPNQALLVGSAPVTGTGLTVLAGSFSGRVVADGYSVGPDAIAGPAHTYAATSDTYWDLGRDGAWHAVVVAALAAEPAVTANATRVYMVRTNATDRTAVTDRRVPRTRVKPHEIWVDAEDEETARISTHYAGEGTAVSPGDHFTLLGEHVAFVAATGRNTVRLYQDVVGNFVLTFGCYWDAINEEWHQSPAAAVARYYLRSNSIQTQAVDPGDLPTWTEADWIDSSLDVQTPLTLLAHLFKQMDIGVARSRLMGFDAAEGGLEIYLSVSGTGGFGPCLEFVRNAAWNEGAAQWQRVAAGIVTKLDLRPGAVRRLEHSAALAANFADSVNPGATWSFPLRYAVFQGACFQIGPGSGNGFNPTAGLIAPGSTGGAATAFFSVADQADGFCPIDAGDIPHGAIIASCDLVVLSPPGNGVLQAALVRIPSPWTSGGVVQALKVSNTYDTIPEVAVTVQTVALTVDASEANRTVDRDAAAYGISVHKTHTDASVTLYEARIGYYVPNAIQ